MDKSIIQNKVVGNPDQSITGFQNDWWTNISPDIWNFKGAYLRDLSGDDYLDCCCFFSTVPIRYDHPRGERTVRFRPQLDIIREIVDEALSLMNNALTKLD